MTHEPVCELHSNYNTTHKAIHEPLRTAHKPAQTAHKSEQFFPKYCMLSECITLAVLDVTE